MEYSASAAQGSSSASSRHIKRFIKGDTSFVIVLLLYNNRAVQRNKFLARPAPMNLGSETGLDQSR